MIVLDNFSTGRRSNLKKHKRSDVKIINVDISTNKNLQKYFRNVKYVFHLAGLADIVPSVKDPVSYFNSNVLGTLNVLESSRKSNIKKFVCSICKLLRFTKKFPVHEEDKINPMYPYAFTKWQAEEMVMHWAKIYKLPAISFRFFNAYGPRSRTTGAYGAVFGVFLAQKLAKKPLTIVGNGKQTRDFIHVKDLVKGLLAGAHQIKNLKFIISVMEKRLQ